MQVLHFMFIAVWWLFLTTNEGLAHENENTVDLMSIPLNEKSTTTAEPHTAPNATTATTMAAPHNATNVANTTMAIVATANNTKSIINTNTKPAATSINGGSATIAVSNNTALAANTTSKVGQVATGNSSVSNRSSSHNTDEQFLFPLPTLTAADTSPASAPDTKNQTDHKSIPTSRNATRSRIRNNRQDLNDANKFMTYWFTCLMAVLTSSAVIYWHK
ncbi:hypothetical protein BDF19DRAFT_424311 [Syncephalis fuscata]|nr:hypothetical protein BDF19DRAFT_424311 [Syncephalis fuscata]